MREDQIDSRHRFSGEKLAPVLAIFKYDRFDDALGVVSRILEVGRGHPVGIASFDAGHIHRLASMAVVRNYSVRAQRRPMVHSSRLPLTQDSEHL